MLSEKLQNYNIILASKSPRRKYLLKELGIKFEINTNNQIKEEYPLSLKAKEIAKYLANKKADAFKNNIKNNSLIITADTIVWINGQILNKPIDFDDAFKMLKQLSGNMHKVITGVCILAKTKKVIFTANTDVYFKKLSDNEIHYYLKHFKPYDKAGSYGIQEWIGYIGIEKINGSYFNVMGLPIQKLYEELMKF
ncbi:MAG: septum formation protein Maf [Bacteroidales bacterium]|nr:septum formation protein Maf [Bacteroidales bacterium]